MATAPGGGTGHNLLAQPCFLLLLFLLFLFRQCHLRPTCLPSVGPTVHSVGPTLRSEGSTVRSVWPTVRSEGPTVRSVGPTLRYAVKGLRYAAAQRSCTNTNTNLCYCLRT